MEIRPDVRYGDPAATPPPWAEVARLLAEAELYWLTTVRPDGRPHVVPLIGLWHEEAFWFCTGDEEVKARNLAHSPLVAVTTGANAWTEGTDVVVEGVATRIGGLATMTVVADAIRTKYDGAWDFAATEDGLRQGDHPATTYRVRPSKVLAFGKDPHSQTAYDFGSA
jgi:nitroimidazol reductase NimA-like FMN-containing flavoprotein (pyridoxamine 5'-phosphate oxidase superfamily)